MTWALLYLISQNSPLNKFSFTQNHIDLKILWNLNERTKQFKTDQTIWPKKTSDTQLVLQLQISHLATNSSKSIKIQIIVCDWLDMVKSRKPASKSTLTDQFCCYFHGQDLQGKSMPLSPSIWTFYLKNMTGSSTEDWHITQAVCLREWGPRMGGHGFWHRRTIRILIRPKLA